MDLVTLMSNIGGNGGGGSIGVQPFSGRVTTNTPFHTKKKKYYEVILYVYFIMLPIHF